MIKIQLVNQEAKVFSEEEVSQFTQELDIKEIGNDIYSMLHNNRSHEISI